MVWVCLMALWVLSFSFYASGQSNWIFWRTWLNAECAPCLLLQDRASFLCGTDQPTPGWRHLCCSQKGLCCLCPLVASQEGEESVGLYGGSSCLCSSASLSSDGGSPGSWCFSQVRAQELELSDLLMAFLRRWRFLHTRIPFSWGCLSCPMAHPYPDHHPFPYTALF